MTYIEYKEDIELSEDDLWHFDTHMRRNYGKGKWSASVWDVPSLQKLLQFSVPFVKVPSALIVDDTLMKAISDSCQNVVISTGMSTEQEIYDAVSAFDLDHHLTVMHCCSAYPCPDEDVDLSVLARGVDPNLPDVSKLEYLLYKAAADKGHLDELDNWQVGFSSHSVSPMPAIYSALLGARMVEVHVTLDRTMEGSDHAASLEEPGLRLLCREIKRIPVLWGEPILRVHDSELGKRKSLRGEQK